MAIKLEEFGIDLFGSEKLSLGELRKLDTLVNCSEKCKLDFAELIESNKRKKLQAGIGLVMIGKRCVKTWSFTQGTFALSSAEAELLAMVESVIRAKGVVNDMVELGFQVEKQLQLHTTAVLQRAFEEGVRKGEAS